MRTHEILGGLYVMVTEDEQNLLDDIFSEVDHINSRELSERQQLIAEDLVKKGVLDPTFGGFKLV